MASFADDRTQLQKDVASNAGVIPIWPWLGDDKKPKDCLPPNIYATMLLQAKIDNNGQEGIIKRCEHDGCEPVEGIGTKSVFWRSNETPENIVPEGWTNYGGIGQFLECPLCRARNHEDGFGSEELEYGREEQWLTDGSTGSTGASDKPLRPLTVSPPIPTTTNIINLCPGNLKDRAREIFKNYPAHLGAVLKQIDDDERKKRAKGAQDRKRKKGDEEYANSNKSQKTGGKRRRKKRTKKRRKSRRRKRTRKRRKSRRRKRTRKRR